jgi:hypothetical protein
MQLERGGLRADVENFVLRLHKTPYPRVVSGGELQ